MRRHIIGIGIVGAALVAGGAAVGQNYGGGYPYASGQDIYTHVCQGCHMPDAKGANGSATYGYPALAGDPKLQAGLYPALVVLKGQKAMPAFSELSDEQVAAVVNYVRTNFGNHYADPITAAQVKAIRPAPATSENRRPG